MPTADNLPTLREIKRIPEFKPLKPQQIRFIAALVKTDMEIEPAADMCGINWRNHYNWKKNEEYAQALLVAKEILADKLEGRILHDAFVGGESDIVFKGQVTGKFREINAHERITLLKGLKPQYRDNATINQFIGPSKINIGTPHLASSTIIDIEGATVGAPDNLPATTK